jgi:hypothetical protein
VEDEELESLLRAARPDPPDAFVDRLERRLLSRAPVRRTHQWRRWAALLGASSAAAGVLLAFALAGANPFQSDSTVGAESGCRTVQATVTVATSEIVADANGRPTVITRHHRAVRPVTKCAVAAGPSTAP